MIVYDWARQPQEEFRAAGRRGASIVLLVITLVANGIAIFLRNRYAEDLVMADTTGDAPMTQSPPAEPRRPTSGSIADPHRRPGAHAGARRATWRHCRSVPVSRDVHLYYGAFRAVKDVSISFAHQDHGAHRAVRLRQVHAAALASTG